LVGVDLLPILVKANPWGWETVASAFSGTDTNDLGVNGARYTVLELQVHLWYNVLVEDRCVVDVTDGSRLDHIADGESLDGLVLWCTPGAVGATNGLDVTSSILVSAVGSSLLHHICGYFGIKWAGLVVS